MWVNLTQRPRSWKTWTGLWFLPYENKTKIIRHFKDNMNCTSIQHRYLISYPHFSFDSCVIQRSKGKWNVLFFMRFLWNAHFVTITIRSTCNQCMTQLWSCKSQYADYRYQFCWYTIWCLGSYQLWGSHQQVDFTKFTNYNSLRMFFKPFAESNERTDKHN